MTTWLLRLAATTILFWVTTIANAQSANTEHIISRIKSLEPIQQHRLQALLALRVEADGNRLFTDEEVRTVYSPLPQLATPLLREELEQLSLHINRHFGPGSNLPFRIVSDDPVFPVCIACADRIGKTCHDSSTKSRRDVATKLLTLYPNLVESVGSLELVKDGSQPRILGTVFVLQGHIVTSAHVLMNETQPAGMVDVRKLKIEPVRRLEVVFGSHSAHRIALPIAALWHRHPSLDLILTKWPAGVAAPEGLTLAPDIPSADTPVALLGFPTENINTDLREEIQRTFGRCPDAQNYEPRMMISMGRIATMSDVALEHNANTMGNSSGSPLIRMTDGALVGVHQSDAKSSVRNLADIASGLTELIAATAL